MIYNFESFVAENLQSIRKEVKERHKDIQKSLLSITQKLELIMSKQDEFKAQVKAGFANIDAETNRIAQDFIDLKDRISKLGISEADEEEILSFINERADRLKQVGKDPIVTPPVETPTEPTPEVPEVPEAPVEPNAPAEGEEGQPA